MEISGVLILLPTLLVLVLAVATHRPIESLVAGSLLGLLMLGGQRFDLAGLPTDAFFFEGFLPSAKTARQTKLESLRDIPGTLVLYESPKRLAEMLRDAAKVLGGTRSAAVCREITKRFEEVKRGDLNALAEEIAEAPVKGEIVVLIDRASEQELGQEDIEAAVLKALETMSVRDAAETVAKATGANKRKIYALALDLKSSQ